MSNRVVHSEVQVDNVERAKKFYGGVFGWDFQDWPMPGGEPYIGVMTASKGSTEAGINGGMLKRPCPAPAVGQGTNAYVCTMQVDNFDETAKKIIALFPKNDQENYSKLKLNPFKKIYFSGN